MEKASTIDVEAFFYITSHKFSYQLKFRNFIESFLNLKQRKSITNCL
jgi:hypothetical protein